MTSLKSQSMTEVTLTTVDGHALKRRRVDYPIQRFKSEATLNSSSTSTSAATVLPSAPLPSVPKPPSRATPSPSPSPPKRLECTPTSSSLSLARRSPSPVPTELDIDNAERPDIDAYLFNTHKVKVIDYASNPPTTNFPRETGSDYSSTSPSRIPEAFFAKDAMAQYEWFMARGSREWDHLSQQGTEVWEDDDDNKEKTQTEAEIRQQRQQIQTTSENSKSPAQSSPRRGQPLRRQQRVPLTGIKLFNDDPATQPSSTPPASSAKPVVSEQEKTPLLPSFTPHNPLALRTSKPKRTYPIPGRILYRLHEIQWVSDEEARQRWLTCDWEEYHAYERQEREKFKDGKRGLMCRGEVGYPYWVVWGSPPSPQGSKKGKEKERAPEPAPQPTPELEPESHPEAVDAPEEEVIESQNVHATLSGTLDTPRTSPEPGAKDETPGSPSPPVEESQSMHPTLSGTIKTPHNTPSPPPVKTPSTTASPLSASSAIVTPANVPSPKPLTSPRKVTNAALAAQLYYLALAQDAELGYGKPPTRDYRRALGERAADVWMWLGEYTRRWGRLAGLGKKEKEVKDNVNNEQPLVIQGVVGGISDDDSGSGRVLGTNAGGLGRTRTLGGLGRTTTLRDLGRAGTLDANAFREVFKKETKTKTQANDAKMDVDVNPSTLSTSTTTSRPLSAKEDVPMDINAELEMSSIRSTIGATVAGTEEQVVLVASSSTRAPAPMAGVAPRSGTQPMDVVVEDQGQGRVTRSAAQRANKRSRPVTHGKAVTEENKELATKRRTRASTRVAGSTKGKEKVRAVEVEPESDVEMTEDKEADDDDGSGDYRASRAGRSSKVANTRNKIKRGIATVQPEAPATGETEGSGSGVTGVAPDLEAPSQVAAGSTRGRGRPRGRPRKATKKRGG